MGSGHADSGELIENAFAQRWKLRCVGPCARRQAGKALKRGFLRAS